MSTYAEHQDAIPNEEATSGRSHNPVVRCMIFDVPTGIITECTTEHGAWILLNGMEQQRGFDPRWMLMFQREAPGRSTVLSGEQLRSWLRREHTR